MDKKKWKVLGTLLLVIAAGWIYLPFTKLEFSHPTHYLLFVLCLLVGFYNGKYGLIMIMMANHADKDAADFGKKMESFGYQTPYKLTVYDHNRELAKSNNIVLYYRYYGKDYTYSPAQEVPSYMVKELKYLPKSFRFRMIINPANGHVLTYDALLSCWYLFTQYQDKGGDYE